MKNQILLGALLCLYSASYAHSHQKAFIENVGQITDTNLCPRTDIDYKVADQQNLQVFVAKGKMHYQWIHTTPTQIVPPYTIPIG
jgi:hypothetical protein